MGGSGTPLTEPLRYQVKSAVVAAGSKCSGKKVVQHDDKDDKEVPVLLPCADDYANQREDHREGTTTVHKDMAVRVRMSAAAAKFYMQGHTSA